MKHPELARGLRRNLAHQYRAARRSWRSGDLIAARRHWLGAGAIRGVLPGSGK